MSDKKYISPEHAIRKIVAESIGVSGSDEFKGTPRSFLKPAPRIAPKKGDTHPDGAAVLAQRGAAKIQSSETMKEETKKKKEDEGESWDPAYDMTPEERSRRDAAKAKANKEALKTAKFDPSKPGLYSRDVPPTEKLKNIVQDTLAKSPVYKDIAGQKANDLASIASNIPFASAIGKAIDSAFYSSKAQPKITGKGQYLAAKGKPAAPDNRTDFEQKVDVYKKAGSQKSANDKMADAGIDAATQIAAAAYLKGVLPKFGVTPSLRKGTGDVSTPSAPKSDSGMEIISPPKEPFKQSRFAQDYTKARAAEKASTTSSKKFDVTGERPPEVIKPEAPKTYYEPSTGKHYDSPGKAKAAAVETQFAKDVRTSAGKVDATKAADKTKPAGPVPELKIPVSKGELVPVTTAPAKTAAPSGPRVSELNKPSDVTPKADKPQSPYIARYAEKLKASSAASKLSNLPKHVTEPNAPPAFKFAEPAPVENLPAVKTSGAEPVKQKAPAKETNKPLPFADKPKPVEFKIADVAPEPPMPGKEPQLQKAPSKSAPPSLPFADKPKPVEFKIADVQPAHQTTVLTRPDIQTKVKPATQAQTTVLTRPEIKIKDKVKPTETKTKNPPPEKPPGKGRKFPFGLPGLTPGQGSSFYQDSNVPVDIYKHVPKEYMNFEQTRYDVENVARPNSKDKVKARSRQAEIVRKIIEEKKASKKKTSTVIINPKLKQEEPEQTQ